MTDKHVLADKIKQHLTVAASQRSCGDILRREKSDPKVEFLGQVVRLQGKLETANTDKDMKLLAAL